MVVWPGTQGDFRTPGIEHPLGPEPGILLHPATLKAHGLVAVLDATLMQAGHGGGRGFGGALVAKPLGAEWKR